MSHLGWADALTICCLIWIAGVFGYCMSERQHAGKFPFEPKKPPVRRWRKA